ncbi:MAG TPA: GNAT family N-acetyltransferase [Verrucomicrobia bacterium]|nr:GNAT family N-acetyltransferase [Verrucomicrobiota bacterium]HCG20275.1 GNAT family N-acetyltransferase [Verrucomicrobiota bacterium]
MTIRAAVSADAPAIAAIYAPYVENTAISFEYEAPNAAEIARRLAETVRNYPYLVAEESGRVAGYAYAGPFKAREAYDRCVETSIYVAQDCRGRGIGRALLTELERQLAARGILNANACIAWPAQPSPYLDTASADFHARMGYYRCAHFHRCGFKFGRWFDMIWMEKFLDACCPSRPGTSKFGETA